MIVIVNQYVSDIPDSSKNCTIVRVQQYLEEFVLAVDPDVLLVIAAACPTCLFDSSFITLSQCWSLVMKAYPRMLPREPAAASAKTSTVVIMLAAVKRPVQGFFFPPQLLCYSRNKAAKLKRANVAG